MWYPKRKKSCSSIDIEISSSVEVVTLRPAIEPTLPVLRNWDSFENILTSSDKSTEPSEVPNRESTSVQVFKN